MLTNEDTSPQMMRRRNIYDDIDAFEMRGQPYKNVASATFLRLRVSGKRGAYDFDYF
jgi:hypothetical protein